MSEQIHDVRLEVFDSFDSDLLRVVARRPGRKEPPGEPAMEESGRRKSLLNIMCIIG